MISLLSDVNSVVCSCVLCLVRFQLCTKRKIVVLSCYRRNVNIKGNLLSLAEVDIQYNTVWLKSMVKEK